MLWGSLCHEIPHAVESSCRRISVLWGFQCHGGSCVIVVSAQWGSLCHGILMPQGSLCCDVPMPWNSYAMEVLVPWCPHAMWIPVMSPCYGVPMP